MLVTNYALSSKRLVFDDAVGIQLSEYMQRKIMGETFAYPGASLIC